MSEEEKSGFVPPPSTGHEIGVMFGFIGAMLLSAVVYAILFTAKNKKHLKLEEEQQRAVRAQYGMKQDEKSPIST